MRKSIRAAVKEGFERIAVVCGAWHAPVLTADALKRYPAKQDDELLKRLPKRKTAATWIPWTYDRLCFDSGYGAGVASPGWYDHLWVHRDQLSARWMIRVARLLRDEDIDASPANVIESVRLADSLAAIRGRQAAGLDELGEATLSVLCHGNPMPVRLIQRKLVVGQRLGQVPDAVPMVPLQRDLDRAPEIAAAEGVGRRRRSSTSISEKTTTWRAATCCIACAFSASSGASCRRISVSGPARFTRSGRFNGGRSLPSRSSRRRNGETPSPTRLPPP